MKKSITIFPSTIRGIIFDTPGNKSFTHRAFILSALASPGSRIVRPLIAKDIDATINGLVNMGMRFRTTKRDYIITKPIQFGTNYINCQNSGSSLRFFTTLATLFSTETKLTGDSSLQKRPMVGLISALNQLGVKVESNCGFPPIIVKNSLPEGNLSCKIDCSVSSQFLSSLLMAGSKRKGTLHIILSDKVVSSHYIELTLNMLQELGIKIKQEKSSYTVFGSDYLPPHKWVVPTDFSSIAIFVAIGSVPGNKITINTREYKYPLPDRQILNIVSDFGAKIQRRKGSITIEGNKLIGTKINLRNSPDLFPIVSVLAARAEGETQIWGAEHLKYKESNRIDSIFDLLTQQGVSVQKMNDGCIISGTGRIAGGGTANSWGDHRVSMATVFCGLVAKHPVILQNPNCVNVSYPSFYKEITNIGGRIMNLC